MVDVLLVAAPLARAVAADERGARGAPPWRGLGEAEGEG
jgi:hypothetical protein